MKNRHWVQGNIVVMEIKCKGETIKTVFNVEDLPLVKSYPGTWYGNISNSNGKIYVKMGLRENGKRRVVQLHTAIKGNIEGKVIDHFNHNTLDNTRNNLRHVTRSVNGSNIDGLNSNNKSGIRGVSWHEGHQRWVATVRRGTDKPFCREYKCLLEATIAVVAVRNQYMRPEAIRKPLQL